mmetsp:Transcript_14664/g.16497  ORF Transcript_14664/g.16497 Transcript_14664/m.16497 type:complete len:332 (-) Transcript_14664:311-1306(-)
MPAPTAPKDCSRTAEITYKVAWMKNDPTIMKDAMQLWKDAGLLQSAEIEMERAKMLCVVAYDGAKLVAVSTVSVYLQTQVQAKGGHFRALVHPQYRRRNIGTELALRCLYATEEWSVANPKEKVVCFVIPIETHVLFPKCTKPTWHGLVNFIGYSEQNVPLYLHWFKHGTIGDEEQPDQDYSFYPVGGGGGQGMGGGGGGGGQIDPANLARQQAVAANTMRQNPNFIEEKLSSMDPAALQEMGGWEHMKRQMMAFASGGAVSGSGGQGTYAQQRANAAEQLRRNPNFIEERLSQMDPAALEEMGGWEQVKQQMMTFAGTGGDDGCGSGGMF